MKAIFSRIAQGYLSKFEVNFQSLQLITRFFYGMTAIVFYESYLRYVVRNWHEIAMDLNSRADDDWIWSVSLVNFIPERSLIVLAFVLTGFLLCVICAMFPHKKWLRVLVFLLTFQCHAFQYSPVIKIDHSYHVLLFVSFWLIFINLNTKIKTPLVTEQNKLYLWAIQISFLGTYFLSGLWKLRYFTGYLMQTDWSEIPRCLATNFAGRYISNNLKAPFYDRILDSLEWPVLNHLLWLGVILFQVFAPVAAWFPSIQRFYGLLIILFHISTTIFMDIRFFPNQYVALIILVCHPYQRKR